MTTVRQLDANRRNAQRSTGPRTQRGKNIASLNAAQHGLYANAPVIPRVENVDDWERHRASTIESLAPSGALEHALAERVALILWRLGRVARFEQNITTIAHRRARTNYTAEAPLSALVPDNTPDAVRQRLATVRRIRDLLICLADPPPDAPLDGSQAKIILKAIAGQLDRFDLDQFSAPTIVPAGVPWAEFPDWTIHRLRQVVDAIAERTNRDPAELIQLTLDAAHDRYNQERSIQRRINQQINELQSERILPSPPRSVQVIRYEAHLMRQLTQTLNHLQAFQRARHAAETPRRPRGVQCSDASTPPLSRTGEGGGG